MRQRGEDAEGALRKIDDAGDAIDEREPQGEDREDAALEQAADDDLDGLVHDSAVWLSCSSGIPVGLLTTSQVFLAGFHS